MAKVLRPQPQRRHQQAIISAPVIVFHFASESHIPHIASHFSAHRNLLDVNYLQPDLILSVLAVSVLQRFNSIKILLWFPIAATSFLACSSETSVFT